MEFVKSNKLKITCNVSTLAIVVLCLFTYPLQAQFSISLEAGRNFRSIAHGASTDAENLVIFGDVKNYSTPLYRLIVTKEVNRLSLSAFATYYGFYNHRYIVYDYALPEGVPAALGPLSKVANLGGDKYDFGLGITYMLPLIKNFRFGIGLSTGLLINNKSSPRSSWGNFGLGGDRAKEVIIALDQVNHKNTLYATPSLSLHYKWLYAKVGIHRQFADSIIENTTFGANKIDLYFSERFTQFSLGATYKIGKKENKQN